VWKKISGDCFADTSVNGMVVVLDWTISLKGESFRVILSRLAWNASIYYCWLGEECYRILKNSRNEEALIQQS
jgi:hypothetical protein